MTADMRAGRVIVVGAGLAGLVTATRAAELGLRVIVLEAGADPLYACNTRISGGLFHVAMADMTAPRDELIDRIDVAMQGEADLALAAALADHARPTIDWLRRQGVTFMKVGPDGLRKYSLAPPRVRRTGLHWRGRAGDVLLRTLGAELARRGGDIRFGHEALTLRIEGGRCTGLHARTPGGEVTLAAEHVVLCDGGFQADMELLRAHVSPAPEKLLMRNARSGRGSGIRMAAQAGAAVVGMGSFYGHVHHRDAMTNEGLWPFPVLDSLCAAGLIVDAHSRRFCDEARGGIAVANAIARLPDPLSTHVIFDQAIWQGPGRNWLLPANPFLHSAGGRVISAPTLHELAAVIDVPADALEKTVATYNEQAAARHAPGSNDKPAPEKAWPIQKAPFHAVPACAGITYTMGGVRTDERARVLDRQGRVIEGLLAAGATTGGLEGGAACGYSGGLSKAAVFGFIAANTLAAQRQHEA